MSDHEPCERCFDDGYHHAMNVAIDVLKHAANRLDALHRLEGITAEPDTEEDQEGHPA